MMARCPRASRHRRRSRSPKHSRAWALTAPSHRALAQSRQPAEPRARTRRPVRQLRAVGGEQRDRQPIHAEGDAAGVRHLAGLVVQAPGRAEMVAVIVEAHAGGRLLGRAHRDRAARTSATARSGSSPSACRRGRRTGRWPDRRGRAGRAASAMPLRARHPALAEIGDLLRRADADIFAHAERLQPVEIARRLAAEAVAGDIEHKPVGRHRAAARRRADRPDSRRPGSARDRPAPASVVQSPPASKRSTAPRMSASLPCRQLTQPSRVRKALEIAGLLQLPAAHDRREAQDLGAGLAVARDQRGEARRPRPRRAPVRA